MECNRKFNLNEWWNFPLQAIVALTFAQYATKPFFPDCEAPGDAVRLLAAVCLGMFIYLNIFLFDQ